MVSPNDFEFDGELLHYLDYLSYSFEVVTTKTTTL